MEMIQFKLNMIQSRAGRQKTAESKQTNLREVQIPKELVALNNLMDPLRVMDILHWQP